jgi:hypothetical protein
MRSASYLQSIANRARPHDAALTPLRALRCGWPAMAFGEITTASAAARPTALPAEPSNEAGKSLVPPQARRGESESGDVGLPPRGPRSSIAARHLDEQGRRGSVATSAQPQVAVDSPVIDVTFDAPMVRPVPVQSSIPTVSSGPRTQVGRPPADAGTSEHVIAPQASFAPKNAEVLGSHHEARRWSSGDGPSNEAASKRDQPMAEPREGSDPRGLAVAQSGDRDAAAKPGLAPTTSSQRSNRAEGHEGVAAARDTGPIDRPVVATPSPRVRPASVRRTASRPPLATPTEVVVSALHSALQWVQAETSAPPSAPSTSIRAAIKGPSGGPHETERSPHQASAAAERTALGAPPGTEVEPRSEASKTGSRVTAARLAPVPPQAHAPKASARSLHVGVIEVEVRPQVRPPATVPPRTTAIRPAEATISRAFVSALGLRQS